MKPRANIEPRLKAKRMRKMERWKRHPPSIQMWAVAEFWAGPVIPACPIWGWRRWLGAALNFPGFRGD